MGQARTLNPKQEAVVKCICTDFAVLPESYKGVVVDLNGLNSGAGTKRIGVYRSIVVCGPSGDIVLSYSDLYFFRKDR